ncbi:MAG: N-acetyltransferase family protein [Oscillospiraceae bacterium]|nr:N-acetyltransferase family protein [Oscillospiraceae bacterium]
MTKVQIRLAKLEDAAQLAAVFAHYVENTTASLEAAPPTEEQMAHRIRCYGAEYPFLVCELDGEIAGYAYAFRRFEEQAFDWSAFVSLYASIGKKGISRALLAALEETLRVMGILNLYVITVHNSKSQYFHLARGFTEAGRLREAAFKEGRWRDLAYYEKSIGLHSEDPEPLRKIGEVDPVKLEEICKRAEKAIRA